MDEPRDPLDLPEQFETDFMNCPSCDLIAEVGPMQTFTEGAITVVTWTTLCLDQHHLTNYWFCTPADEPVDWLRDVTPPGS